MDQTKPYSKRVSEDRKIGKRRFWKTLRAWLVPLTVIFTLLLWEILSKWSGLPEFILPAPSQVLDRGIDAVLDGTLGRHTLTTLSEVIAGLLLGSFIATILGYMLARSPALERIASPYIVASQSIPIVAIAPLLVIWFGPGRFSKVLICALIVFFPVLINTIVGVRSVPSDLRDLMRSLRATRWQTFSKLELPAAMPVFLGGLKIGATLAVIGAVVGEFIGSDEGLGFLINLGRGLFDTSLVFVAVIMLVVIAMGLFGFVVLLERYLLRWQNYNELS